MASNGDGLIRNTSANVCRDYLKFLQLSVDDAVDDEFACEASLDDTALEGALAAIRSGTMRAVRPAMKVFFDGCRFWLASHFHRSVAAGRLGVRHQEFWCEIEPLRYSTAFVFA